MVAEKRVSCEFQLVEFDPMHSSAFYALAIIAPKFISRLLPRRQPSQQVSWHQSVCSVVPAFNKLLLDKLSVPKQPWSYRPSTPSGGKRSSKQKTLACVAHCLSSSPLHRYFAVYAGSSTRKHNGYKISVSDKILVGVL